MRTRHRMGTASGDITVATATTDRQRGDRVDDEIQKKKEYLQQYRNLRNKIRSLEDQLESLREVEQSAKIQQLSDMPKGSKHKDLSDYMVKLDRMLMKIDMARHECLDKKLEIEGHIADMENGLESIVLHMRYIDLISWDQISYGIKYSKIQTYRIHGSALKNLVI